MTDKLTNDFISIRSKKDRGVVFTDPRIAEKMSALLPENPGVVIDYCAGTGKLLASVKNAEKKIAIEIDPDIAEYCKTNTDQIEVIVGDCFSHNIKADNAVLNPPYANDKYGGRNELEFILHVLNNLNPGGYLSVIVPMSSGISSKKKEIELRTEILKQHQILEIHTMRSDIFDYVTVNTIILLIRAHTPNSEPTKMFTGEHETEALLGSEDECCAEAYLTPDYSTITYKTWLSSIKQQIMNEIAVKVDQVLGE